MFFDSSEIVKKGNVIDYETGEVINFRIYSHAGTGFWVVKSDEQYEERNEKLEAYLNNQRTSACPSKVLKIKLLAEQMVHIPVLRENQNEN